MTNAQSQPTKAPPEQSPPPSPVYNPGQGRPDVQPATPSEKTFDTPGAAPEIPSGPGGDEWQAPSNHY